MNLRSSLILITMTCYPLTPSAQEAIFSDAPSLEFLEFLGEWEDSEGEWIDPNQFDEDYYASSDVPEEENKVEVDADE